MLLLQFKKVNDRWLIEYFYLKTDYRLGWIEIYVLFRWFFSTPLLSCFSFDPSVLFSSTALFRITPISVNDILASFPISYWFLPSFKSLKTSLFLSWLVITENFFNNISNYTKQNLKTLVTTCYLFCCLVIICFQLLPMYSIWILIISNNSCYVWVRSDGNQHRKLHIIMVMNFLIIQNIRNNNTIESNDKISNKPALSSLIF